MGEKVYRGQIVGLSGNTGINSGGYPQLHFNLQDNKPQNNVNGWTYIDINRYIVNLNPLPVNFWGSPVSYWTSDNNPQFSK
jgi:murein DD-endopeptidase MepM/ murein hydrolase activator NlpD